MPAKGSRTRTQNGGSSVAEIVWSPQDWAGLSCLRRPLAARLVDSVERLAQFPDSGRVVPEFQDRGLREVLWRNYRVVYRTSRAQIEVVAVFHGSRLFLVDGPLGA